MFKFTKMQRMTLSPLMSIPGETTMRMIRGILSIEVCCNGANLTVTYHPGGQMSVGGVHSPVPSIIIEHLSELVALAKLRPAAYL